MDRRLPGFVGREAEFGRLDDWLREVARSGRLAAQQRLHGAKDRRELPAVATPRYLLRDPAADHATPDLVL